MAKVIDIEGIGPSNARKLREAGVRSVASLLKCGRTAKDRQDLAEATGIDPSRLLEWINQADLFRVPGIGAEYADLLEEAGVDTVPELGKRNPDALYETLVKTNEQKRIVRKMPTVWQVSSWVEQAKLLPRAIEY